MNRDRTKEAEDDEEVEARREKERDSKRKAWREVEGERIKASWVSISRVEASREDSLGLQEG